MGLRRMTLVWAVEVRVVLRSVCRRLALLHVSVLEMGGSWSESSGWHPNCDCHRMGLTAQR